MRTVVGSNTFCTIVALGKPGAGGANSQYGIFRTIPVEEGEEDGFKPSAIHFQEGPIRGAGVNGCQQEDLLAIVIDRLEAFQCSPFACHENEMALFKCKEALHWLNHRTEDRKRRGVEGTMIR